MSEAKPNWNWRDDDDNVHRLYDGDEPITLGDPCFDTPEQEERLCQAVNSYDDMLAALEAVKKHIHVEKISNSIEFHMIGVDDMAELEPIIDAAIAKAKGGTK